MAVTINGTTGIDTPDITSDSATIDSTTLVVDEANNRVGIGTSSPTAPLHIYSSSANRPLIESNSTSQAGLILKNTDREFRILNGSSSLSVYDQTSGSQAMLIDSTGNLKFNSGYGSVVTAYGCRAWVNFDGTGTPSINIGRNVSSITDNGTGDYTINFTTAFPDANYALSGMARSADTAGTRMASINLKANATANTTTFARITIHYGNTDIRDCDPVTVAVFR